MAAIAELLEGDKPLTWLFYGDSITHGALHTFGSRDYTQHFAERIRFEMGRGMDVVINTAISGNTTDKLLESFDLRVARYRPDVAFIMIGMNDAAQSRGVPIAAFRDNLQELCDRVMALGTFLVLQTANPILPGADATREPHYPAYMDCVRELAEVNDLLLVDHERAWREQPGEHYFLMSDAIHPNQHGHLLFAHTLFEALGIFDPGRSRVCRLNVLGTVL